MAVLDRIKSFLPHQQKQVNTALFQFFSPTSMPKMKEWEYLLAYRGWVFAAANAIAERMADIELRLEEKQKDGWKEIEEHDALAIVHKVNAFTSYYDLICGTQIFLELTGNAFWYIVQSVGGKPSEIWMLDPTRVSVVKDKQNFIKGYTLRNDQGKDIPFEVDEIIHFKRFNPKDPYRGMGTLEAAAIAVDTDTYASEWQRNFFGNSAQPSGILSTVGTLTEEQYTRIKTNWDATHRGVANAHKMAILEGGLAWQSITPTANDMQLSQFSKDKRDEILAYFRVPKAILGLAEDFNRANIDGIEYIFAKYVIKPKMKFFVHTLNEYYLPKFKLDPRKYRLSFHDPVPENIEEKLKINESGRKYGYLSINEARANIGQEPIKGKDELDAPIGQGGTNVSPQGDTSGQGKKKRFTKGKKIKLSKEQKEQAAAYKQEQMALLKDEYLKLNTDLRARLLMKLDQYKRYKPKTLTQKLLRLVKGTNELVNFLLESTEFNGWVTLVYNATEAGLTRILEGSGKQTFAHLNMETEFDLQNPRALDWLTSHALEASTSYTDNIKEALALKVQEGVEQGLSNDKIANSLAEWFDGQSDYRAERIARTETINAYAQGNLEGYRQSGVVSGKFWISDGEACDICNGNVDAGVIGLDKNFPSGHDAPTAHPNCECALGGETDENA